MYMLDNLLVFCTYRTIFCLYKYIPGNLLPLCTYQTTPPWGSGCINIQLNASLSLHVHPDFGGFKKYTTYKQLNLDLSPIQLEKSTKRKSTTHTFVCVYWIRGGKGCHGLKYTSAAEVGGGCVRSSPPPSSPPQSVTV